MHAGRATRLLAGPSLLVAGVLAPFWSVALSRRTLAWGVGANLFAPIRPLVVEALQDLRLPLWNPFEATGVPLFAEALQGVLHPLSLLSAFLAPARGLDLVMLLYLAWAALGAHALARTLGISRAGAVASGFAYGLGGFTVSMTGNLPFLAGVASAPWSVAGLRLAGVGHPRGVAAAAVSGLLCVLSGDYQAVAIAGALGLALAAEGGGWRGLMRAGAGGVAGLLMGGIQLWPSWVHLGRTVRGLPLPIEERTRWSLAVARVVEWVAPGFFCGRMETTSAAVYEALTGSKSLLPFASSVFVGAPVFLLAWHGARASRTARTLAVAALVVLWIAFGQRFGAEQILHALPVWNRFRFTEKLMGPFTLCVAVLAGLGVDRVSGGGLGRGVGRAALGGLVLSLALLALIALAPDGAESALRLAGAATPRGDAAPLVRTRLAEGLVHTTAGLTAAVGLLAAARKGVLGRFAGWTLAALFLAESAAALPYARHLGIWREHGAPAPPPLVADVPVARVDVPFVPSPARSVNGMDEMDAESYTAARMVRPAHNVELRIDSFRIHSGFPPLRLQRLLLAPADAIAGLARRFGTTHLILPPIEDDASRELASWLTAGGTHVWTDPELEFNLWSLPHRPWASFAPAAAIAGDAETALGEVVERVRARDGTVVVESSATPAVATGRVLAVQRGVEWSRVRAEADGEALLVVNDAYWPGWQATIDGRPVEILAADALVRAVRWPPGRHVLEMRYRPPEIAVGWAISASGLALFLFLSFAWRARSAGGGRDRSHLA